MFASPGTFDFGEGLDVYLVPCLSPEQAFFEMTANEDTTGDSVSYRPNITGHAGYDFVDVSPHEHVYASQPDAIMDDVSAASVASHLSGGRVPGSHVSSDQSIAAPVLRVEVVSASASSHSPGTDPVIMTPGSGYTLQSWRHPDGNDSDDNISPTSSAMLSSEFDNISTAQGDDFIARQVTSTSSGRPPPSPSAFSGASDAHPGSRGSSIAPSFTGYTEGMSHWGTFHVPIPGLHYTDQLENIQDNTFGAWTHESFDSDVASGPAQHLDDDLLSGFDGSSVTTALPIRTTSEAQTLGQTSFDAQHIFTQDHVRQESRYVAPGAHRTDSQRAGSHIMLTARGTPYDYAAVNNSSAFTPMPVPPTKSLPPGYDLVNRRGPPQSSNPSTHPRHPSMQRFPPTVPSQAAVPQFLLQYTTQPALVRHNMQEETTMPRVLPTLAPSEASAVETTETPQVPTVKGGRRKGQPLSNARRLQSSAMRKRTACWRCALQRDSCDQGAPCNRCVQSATKGNLTYFGCDRSKLPDLVYDFLPLEASMTIMHQKQSIEDTIKEQVMRWDHEYPIDVYLSSGYGPPLRWTLYEFKPRTTDLLGQFQYVQNRQTGEQERLHKYSPPLGVMKLDTSNDTQVENYLTTLMDQTVLWDLGWTFYEEESQIDPDQFQARLLDQMCRLYIQTDDPDLAIVLKNIIRMMIITYIMGHTLTISDDTLPAVINHIKHTPRYPTGPHTSPRLANRQLKLYFSVMRKNIYEGILNWLQQTLHSSGKKEGTWLAAFCATLSLGMVLEEVQRTLYIQMDAKITKEELPQVQAIAEAKNACERIDDRFKLLVGLFQCKYRDKRWGADGSFGSSTPRLRELCANQFLANVRELLVEKRDHLVARRDVEFNPRNQCLYTSRLTARFLLPFLNLP